MQLTQVITFLTIAIVGAVAAPGGHVPPPPPAKPTTVVQQVFYGCHLVTCYAVLIPHLD
jgi:hypothetical protein